MDVQTFISQHHNAFVFLKEFVFARTRFTPPESSEVEFADAVVLLGDVLVIFQIKERSTSDAGNEESERRWFGDKVLGKATRQVRDTLSYLSSGSPIIVPNERGHTFDLAANKYKEVIKVVMYAAGENLPADCRRIHHYQSSVAGHIHVVDARDYLAMTRTLRVPMDIVEYFRFRESLIEKFPQACADCDESALAGHFIEARDDEPPCLESAQALSRLVDDGQQWDLGPILRDFYDRISTPHAGLEHYEILREFIKLPRSAWRAARERINLCLENIREGRSARPYRFTSPSSDCGFVFVTADPELSKERDWPEMRDRALQNFTIAHKYDQRLSRCVGMIASRHEPYVDMQWCLVSHPWEEDEVLGRLLQESNPFLPVSEREQFGYFLRDE